MADSVKVTEVEHAIRTKVQTRRMRLAEFFKDYDRLRSGCITKEQFRHTLDDYFLITLSDAEMDCLFRKYSKDDRMINYRAFCDTINVTFDPSEISNNPDNQLHHEEEYLGTNRTLKPTGDQSAIKSVKEIQKNIVLYYKYHGINIRTCFEDYDRHHNGLVTDAQFARSLLAIGPAELTSCEVDAITRYYHDPKKPGLVNYLNFHHDIEKLKMDSGDGKLEEEYKPYGYYGNEHRIMSAPVKDLLEKIRIWVFKQRIRTNEFFRDNDKLRKGVVTRDQFVRGLSMIHPKLNKEEIDVVADHCTIDDGRVEYKWLCFDLEHTFNIPALEKNPTAVPERPPRGALGRVVRQLTPKDEARLEAVLDHVRDNVSKRRLLLFPYFKDYDRGQGFNRTVTKSQFSRIMQALKINILMSDVEKICRKFEDESGCGEINYPEFCQYVDNSFLHSTVEQRKEVKETENAGSSEAIEPLSEAERKLLIDRISHHVLVNRIRVCDFFCDFDKLRSGLISRSIFARVLKSLRLNVDHRQVASLMEYYHDEKKPDMIKWREFTDDTVSIPYYNTCSDSGMPRDNTEILEMDRLGTENWDGICPTLATAYERVMARFRGRCHQRRVHMKPMFQDFDQHNYGYVTKNQFRQCLSFLDLNAEEEEKDALEARYCDQHGFRYFLFLADVELANARKSEYEGHLARRIELNANKKPREVGEEKDPKKIMIRLQAGIFRERIRIMDTFIDYDKLRKGRIKRVNFLRALKQLELSLLESECNIVADLYASQDETGVDMVEYRRLCRDMQTCDVRHQMQLDPLSKPVDYKLPSNLYSNELSPDLEPIFEMTMNRIAEHIRRTRTQLHPLFEDYDRVHNGTVSRSQFHRVLSELEMGGLLNEQEFRLIFTKFGIRRGGQFDVNYLSFCETVYEKAKFEVGQNMN
jgi:Ca2+-binding EF-hand superfamily protein